MGEKKEKRRGGLRDDSNVHISYSRKQLMQLIEDTERKIGAKTITKVNITLKK